MIIWGSGGGGAELGDVSLQECSVCEKERPFRIFLQYKYAHLYYLRWVTKKQYHLACDVCRRGTQLDTKEVESKLVKSPIPFMTRFGWVFLIGIMTTLVVVIRLSAK